MNKTKTILQSKTIWGISLAGIPTLFQNILATLVIFGLMSQSQADDLGVWTQSLIISLTQIFGIVMAVYGRIKANHTIK